MTMIYSPPTTITWGDVPHHCETCRHYNSERCHRNAPTADGWPRVAPLDSCGEWMPIPAPIFHAP